MWYLPPPSQFPELFEVGEGIKGGLEIGDFKGRRTERTISFFSFATIAQKDS